MHFVSIRRFAVGFPGLLAFASASLWGLFWLPLRLLDELGFNGMWAVFAINAVPLACLLPVGLKRVRALRADARDIAIIGILIGLSLTGYALGLYYSTIMRATLLYYLTPIWSTLLAMMILNERVNVRRWIAIILGLLGVTIIMSVQSESAKPLNIGDFAALGSGIMWGLGVVWVKRRPDLASVDTVFSEFFFASLGLLLFILLFDDPAHAPSYQNWLQAAPILAVFTLLMVPSLFIILWAAQRVSPGRIGILMLSEVLVAGVSSAWLAREYMTTFEWLAAVLIVSAALLDIDSGRDPEPV